MENKFEPILIKNKLKWDMLNWKLEEWAKILGNTELEYRCGAFAASKEPQWERKTKIRKGDFKYFLENSNNNTNWLYFDYKYLNTWFKNNEELRNDINWEAICSGIKPDDCTIWIGSKGAHTPCHLDCYGFNIVHQIYGKKLWLLFPPGEDLKPSRIPYEESSIYSKLNFFSPDINEFKHLDNCKKVVLEAGDVLVVPHKWWHYVENLETSISINVWMPTSEDDEERLQESVVQFMIKQLTSLLNDDLNKIVLNPNMDDLINSNSTDSFLNTLFECRNVCLNKRCGKEDVNKDAMYKLGDVIPTLSKNEFDNFIKEQINRFTVYNDVDVKSDDYIDLIDAFTCPQVVNNIKNILLKSFNK